VYLYRTDNSPAGNRKKEWSIIVFLYEKGNDMGDTVLFHTLLLLALLWLWVILLWVWPQGQTATGQTTPTPATPIKTRSTAPKPFPGLIHKPHCEACAHAAESRHQAPSAPPPLFVFTRGRRRHVDTQHQFCPHPPCDHAGWVGRGNLRANGHPGGGPWRQWHCVACGSYFLETHGTPVHGTRVPPERLVWAVGALAEGLGIRAVARVFEVDPNTVLAWLMVVVDHAAAFSQYFLHDVRVMQVQLDELFALLSAVKAGEVSEAEAIERLSRSPHWVWVAIDPVTKLLLTIDVGDHTPAIAQRIVHQVVQVLAPDCVPLFLTDGFQEYMTALLTHDGLSPRRDDSAAADSHTLAQTSGTNTGRPRISCRR
jgi:transposase-like protein